MIDVGGWMIEPTSALDSQSAKNVEDYLVYEVKSRVGRLRAIVWITHSEEQGRRVGSKFLRITAGGIEEERMGPAV